MFDAPFSGVPDTIISTDARHADLLAGYLDIWATWNYVRTATSSLAAVLLALSVGLSV